MHTTCAPILRAAGALMLSTLLLAATDHGSGGGGSSGGSHTTSSSSSAHASAPRASTPDTAARRGYGPTIRGVPPPMSLSHPGTPHAPPGNGGRSGGNGGGGWISFDSPWGGDVGIGYDEGDAGTAIIVPPDDESPADTALRSYGLEPADCNAPTPLVVIDTPDHRAVCALPNETIRAGRYKVDPTSRTLTPV